MAEQEGNIKQENNSARGGMNMDLSTGQIPKGVLSYALNASVENFDANSTSYQNEAGNELCLNFPEGYQLIGSHSIYEQDKHIFFLVNPETGDSEIGYMDNNDCNYKTYINSKCLNFSIHYPIHKAVHKITNCTTEIYWTDGKNPRRFLDLNKIPYKTEKISNSCDVKTLNEIDCNKISVQPNFNIPQLDIIDVVSGGNLTAGTVQFAAQYSDVAGNGYTSYYSVTNPLPIANTDIITSDFNYNVGKSVILNISNIDTTGYFQYFNVAVIKTINGITSVELVGTYTIDEDSKQIVYSGQNENQVRLTIGDIFEKFPLYEIADDITSVQDILVWKGLTSIDRINYQQIANKIKLQWQSYRIPANENYADEINATKFRSQLRDEVYPYEIVFLQAGGKQTDSFHIPGRAISDIDLSYPEVTTNNPDYIGDGVNPDPYWKTYNTAYVTETDPSYVPFSDYKGPYQTGEFAYWESTETYPCNSDIWGELAGKPIRHHKFPDVKVSPIFESLVPEIDSSGKYINLQMEDCAIFPIGVKININEIKALIIQSDLTQSQKDAIIGFKIVRGNRDVNKSIVAKGILRNVGKYEREGTEYYFPNYPYNDLREDPFLLSKSNGYSNECSSYEIVATADGEYQYTDCFTNAPKGEPFKNGDIIKVCSLSLPTLNPTDVGTISAVSYDTYEIIVEGYYRKPPFTINIPKFAIFTYKDARDNEDKSIKVYTDSPKTIQVYLGSKPEYTVVPWPVEEYSNQYSINQVSSMKDTGCYPERLHAFETDDSKYRHVFNSPETSFGKPFLGDVLKLESVLYGGGKAHFSEVKKNALYKLLTKEAQEDALLSSAKIADITSSFDSTAMFTAYQAYLQIYLSEITRKNYGWSYNSILNYNYSADIDNELEIKQRKLENAQYLFSGVQSVGENINFNNFQRESSVYLKTTEDVIPLPYPNETPALLDLFNNAVIEDKSRYINSQQDCSQPEKIFDISSVVYYASIKNNIPNQWGQVYSYETIDTGTQVIFDNTNESSVTVFGGDTFINKFSFKTKLPFFIDNRVGAPDDSDIFYDEIGNVAYPEYWHSARSILFDFNPDDFDTDLPDNNFSNIISIKAHVLDCPNNQLPKPDPEASPKVVNINRTFYDGKMYMFAYGIPTFYVESSINIDLRQAFNNKEGDFYPHVSNNIPDDWVQESNVPISQDNTYYYNSTYSKQNKENFFSHLPDDWREQLCFTKYPFRGIFSDSQQSFTDNRINSWLIYRPVSYFDFPQNYGEFTSIDGIDNKQVLARFHNKSLLYNALYTTQTNTQGQVYLGQSLFSKETPPLDFAETNLGYMGSQHKFLLKIPQGQVTVDSKRGQIFLISGSSARELSGFGSGVNRFLTNHLIFEISKSFPEVDIDNHFNRIGLHGVFDSKYNRIIISKLDYVPLSNNVKYDSVSKEFYTERIINNVVFKEIISVTDNSYFCNKSWTLSFNFNTNSWVSFHSYIPNWYIAENNFFYSGINDSCDLEAIAAVIVSTTTTTSTSTTSTTTSTTSTTTTSTTTASPFYYLNLSLTEDTQEGTDTWQAVFDGLSDDTLSVTNNGSSDNGTIVSGGNVDVTVTKITNSGITLGSVEINYYKNGLLVATHNIGNLSTGLDTYTFTGLSSSDLLSVEVNEIKPIQTLIINPMADNDIMGISIDGNPVPSGDVIPLGFPVATANFATATFVGYNGSNIEVDVFGTPGTSIVRVIDSLGNNHDEPWIGNGIYTFPAINIAGNFTVTTLPS